MFRWTTTAMFAIAVATFAGVPLWEKVKVPALAIRGGEHGPRFTPEIMAEIRQRAPQVQLAVVPASDHHITLDNPQGFVDAVRTFLEERDR